MKTIITANPITKLVINPTSNPAWSRIRVEQTKLAVNDGIMQMNKRSALVNFETEKAEAFANLLVAGQEYPIEGTIVVKESTTPFWNGQEPKINPATGEALVDAKGNYIYRTTEFVNDVEAKDELIAHAAAVEYTNPVAKKAAEEDIAAETITEETVETV